MENESISALLIISENFSECIANQKTAIIEVYMVLRSIGFGEATSSARVNMVINTIKQVLVNYLILSIDPNADPNFVTNPVMSSPTTV